MPGHLESHRSNPKTYISLQVGQQEAGCILSRGVNSETSILGDWSRCGVDDSLYGKSRQGCCFRFAAGYLVKGVSDR